MTEMSGMKEAMRQAEVGMQLFKASEKTIKVDVAAATLFKEEIESQIKTLEEEVAALPGKENKTQRVAKEKARTSLKNQHDYIDACKIVKGLDPVHGFFVTNKEELEAPAPVAAAAEETVQEVKKKDSEKKPKKKEIKEAAGLSKDEKIELDELKQKIIDKKAALKEEGKTGGQINKDEEVVAWVTRMNELKEKENPGSSGAGKKDEKKMSKKKSQSADAVAKQKEIDDYTEKLKNEFGYTKKDIAADPDLNEMKAELKKLTG